MNIQWVVGWELLFPSLFRCGKHALVVVIDRFLLDNASYTCESDGLSHRLLD